MATEFENWVSINLPEGCPNVCISFKREIAETQVKEFGAKPLYGFDQEKEDWLPVEVFITYVGWLAPNQRLQEKDGTNRKKERLLELRKILANNRAHIPERELRTKHEMAYGKILREIAELESELGNGG